MAGRRRLIASLTETDIANRLAGKLEDDCQSDLLQERAREVNYPQEFLQGPPRPAAVLIPFLQRDGEWHVLFTRRTESLVEHRGQVAFPGGRSDASDPTPEATALREANEEIGLRPSQVHVLGRLDSFLTITNYCVTPVVGAITWPFTIRLAKDEVSRVFTIPLRWLADPNHHEVRARPLPLPYPPLPVIYFQPYDGELLWGVSAFITVNLIKRLFSEDSDS